MERYDLVVIGCGPAGEKGAVQAAWLGRKVLVVAKEARDDGLDYVVGRSQFADNARGQIMSETGLLKLVVDATDKRSRGAHIVGERASELIHVVQAHTSHGATIEHDIEQVFNNPTLGEAFKDAAYEALGRLSDRRGGR